MKYSEKQASLKASHVVGVLFLAVMASLGVANAHDVAADGSTHVTVSGGRKAAAKEATPEHHGSLANQATSPVAPLISARLQYSLAWDNYNSDDNSTTVLGQFVVPFKTSSKAVPMIVTRTTIPYVITPNIPGEDGEESSVNNLGDSVVLAFGVLGLGLDKATWAVGPAITIPTAGDNEFTGSGQWQAGPAVAFISAKIPTWQWGGMFYSQHDFASTRSGAKDVNKYNIQPILTKHFKGGWYVAAPDVPQVYDGETNKWILNLGGVVGRVGPVGNQPMQIYSGVYYNTEDDNGVQPEWTFKLNFSWLFPSG
jgi:hypothetical protein